MATTTEVGQFDDPILEATTPPHIDLRAEHPYIDTASYDSDDLPLPGLSDEDEDSVDDEYNETRIEDEDWEIAERGVCFICKVVLTSTIPQRFHQALQSPSTACRCTNWQCSRIFLFTPPVDFCGGAPCGQSPSREP